MERYMDSRGPAFPTSAPTGSPGGNGPGREYGIGGDAKFLTDFRDSPNMTSLAAETILFREGGLAEVMYVLLEGTVDILIGGTAIESVAAVTVLGEMAIIDGAPRSATAISRTPCLIASVTAAQFDILVREKPELARFVMQVLSGRLRRMNQRLLEAFAEISVR